MQNSKSMQKGKQQLVVVLGMHRSGTSAIARGLQTMGVALGDRLQPSAKGINDKGYWEDIDFVALNAEMLEISGRSWHSLDPIQTIDVDNLCDRGYLSRATDRLHSKIHGSECFGLKDPRTAVLLPFWERVFVNGDFNVRYVFAIRNPLSVVNSLTRRDGFDPEKSFFLWAEHMVSGLANIGSRPFILLDYDRLISDPEGQLSRLANWLGSPLDPEKLAVYRSDFLDEKLRHSKFSSADVEGNEAASPLVREIYSVLMNASNDLVSVEELRNASYAQKWKEEIERVRPILKLCDKQGDQLLKEEAELRSLKIALQECNKFIENDAGKISTLTQSVIERDREVSNLAQSVIGRDQRISTLTQSVIERDEKISTLTQSVIDGDGKISDLYRKLAGAEELRNQQISQIRKSFSWKVTAPVRFLGSIFLAGVSIFRLGFSFLKNVDLPISVFRKLTQIYRCKGWKGLRGEFSRLFSRGRVVDEGFRVDDYNIPVIEFDSMKEGFCDYRENKKIDPLVKVIAFYLPQFHPFPENDEWWGKGFTEWTNVGKAKPNYVGHYQPHCPIHLGYYDLRVPSVMEEQAKLAKEYGVSGFNYYFYWFGGKILMDTPLEMMLSNKSVDMPFCLTWANENWSRRWDGQENDILIAQKHSDEDSIEFILHLVKYFRDDRYIKIDGKPLLIIYRPGIIPQIKRTAALWREEIVRQGFPGLYLIAAQTFGARSPEPFDFDASMQFPPHTVNSHEITGKVDLINQNFSGHIFSYDEVVRNEIANAEPSYKLFRTAMLSWDNSARKQNASHIFHEFSLLRYKQWLASLINKVAVSEKYSEQEKIVFVNAWNEWAEGTHLEPDQKYGYGYLQATYEAISDYDKGNAVYLKFPENKARSSDCAIILHAHYAELLPELKSMIEDSFEGRSHDLFITTTSLKQVSLIKNCFPEASVMLVENRGRDILPFIRTMKYVGSLGYKHICKLHTKKSLYRSDGEKIRADLLKSLIGDAERVGAIISRFASDASVGMVVPDGYLLRHNDINMKYNRDNVAKIANSLNISFDFDVFPAGSMFWFRPEALSSLQLVDEAIFEVESGLADGTAAHAMERIMGALVRSKKMNIVSCSAAVS